MDSDPDKWFWDRVNKHLVQLHSIEEVLYTGQTKFQSIEIIRSGNYGRFLVLDSKIQSSDADEFIYHEALVQPPMITHAGPETVFIAGGGEGATLREVLSHNTVKRAVMVDIDEEVINICQQYLPDYSRGSFQDPRAEVLYTDAREYLTNTDESFDIIIIDLPEPIEEGPAYLLYTQEFYEIVKSKLTPNGIISVQSGSASWTELENLSAVNYTLKSVFPIVCVYQADIPAFGGPWGFCQASSDLDPLVLSPTEIDDRISARGISHLKFYDGLTHQAIFSLPKHLRNALSKPDRLITDGSPLFMYQS
ncbi:MAG TPA: polyamine aminopropyltransferase [Dehalococcoidia bacterium]|nr:polyamine aminopropyltransferase [Dehalococcoidia bacterium]